MRGENMIRKVIITTLSFLAVVIIIVGLLSIWISIEVKRKDWRTNIKIEEGRLVIGHWYDASSTNQLSQETWQWGGMGIVYGLDLGGPLRHNIICIPLWLPLALLLIYPSYAVIRGPLRRHRRRKKSLCANCAYNLTGNVSGICPECGERI